MERATHPQWGIVGAGMAGGALTAAYLDRTGGRGIDDRFLFLATNRATARRHFDRVESGISIESDEFAQEHLVQFGPHEGVGNDCFEGRRVADANFETIREGITSALDGSDSLVYPLGLGGRTGNGTVPYLIDRLGRGSDDGSAPAWLAEAIHIALGVWPFEHESAQRHFNAVCGLSRLLARDDGTQNAEMTLLADNSRMRELVSPTNSGGDDAGHTAELREINDRIADALELFVSAARSGSHVITPRDFTAVPKRHGIAHATFGTALGKPVALDVSSVLDRAAENAFVPLDLSTVGAAYAVVRAPEARVEAGDLTVGAVNEAFARWKAEQGLRDTVGMTKLIADPDATGLDALVVLGGFDLDPLLSASWDRYEQTKAALPEQDCEADSPDLDRLESNLDRYR